MKTFLAGLALLFAAGAFAQSVTVWTPYTEATLARLQADVADFGAATGLDVEVVKLDINELKQQMLLSAPEGDAGDVLVGIPHDQMAELAVAGVLADLSGHATSAYLADLSEQARLAFTYAGGLFGLPLFVEGPALLFNQELIEELPATYEAFIDEAAELTVDDRFGFLLDIDNFYFNYAWLSTHGGYVFGRTGGSLQPNDVGLANAGAVRGAEALRALHFEHGLIPPGTNYDVAHDLFVDGAVAAFYSGPWAVRPAREAGIDVGVAPIPPLADGTPWSGFMGVEGVLVNEFSERRTDAVNLAKWLTRPEAQVLYAQREGRIPASERALEQVADDAILAGFGEALLHSEPIPNLPRMGRVWGAMDRAIRVLTEREDADVAGVLEQAVREITGE